jgi:N-acetylglutamate synthase-like GNAT family acetyltransferase
LGLRIVPIEQADYAALAGVLAENNLLAGDLDGDNKHFFAFVDGSGWRVGVGGLELYGAAAILRSFFTIAHHRGQGLGGQMLEELLSTAKSLGVSDVFLFTVEAEAFFAKHGFAVVDRTVAPTGVRDSREFAEHCDNASFMHRKIA